MPTPRKATAPVEQPAQQPAKAPRGYTPQEALAVAVKRARGEETPVKQGQDAAEPSGE